MNPATLIEWTRLFGTLSAPEGAKRAHEVVLLLSGALLGYHGQIEVPEGWRGEWRGALAGLPVQPAMLALPWRAFHLAQSGNPEDEARLFEGGVRAILATIPMDYQIKSLLGGAVSLDVDSVLDCMAALIGMARRRLWVMAPYWREQGIEHLKRKVGSLRAHGLEVTVITAFPLSAEDAAGCTAFKLWMEQAGARTSHWIPKTLTTGARPLMHIKAVMADSEGLYLGSANPTDFGLHRSLELGVWLEGAAVAQVERMLALLMTEMESISEGPFKQ